MKTSSARLWISVSVLSTSVLLFGSIKLSHAQQPSPAPHSGQFQTAEQHFKNIQVLKNIPADQLIPSMQFIAASLGVECEFCHVEHANDKDDKKTKLAARKMITMMMAINQANFNGDLEVTCYTCHRGVARPVSTPVLSADAARPPAQVHDEAGEAHPALPSADQILDKYLGRGRRRCGPQQHQNPRSEGNDRRLRQNLPHRDLLRSSRKARVADPPSYRHQRHRLQRRSWLAQHSRRLPSHDCCRRRSRQD